MADMISAASCPFLYEARAIFRAQQKFSADIVDRTFTLFGDEWADRFEQALRSLFPTGDGLAAAIKGYSSFAMTSLRLQAKFERAGEYQAKSYAEAAAEVYHNELYMQSEYLPGLFLSHYLWPHHYRQILFFESAFLKLRPVAEARSFLEVGVGTGLYSRIALQASRSKSGRGIDISPYSKSFAERQMEAFGLGDRYMVDLEDVIGTAEASAEALICVEVLEHLEEPVEFLRALRRVLKPGGRAFVTAAINSAHTDHIYLYRNALEVEAQIVEAGFNTEEYMVAHAYAPVRAGLPVPVAAAFIVS